MKRTVGTIAKCCAVIIAAALILSGALLFTVVSGAAGQIPEDVIIVSDLDNITHKLIKDPSVVTDGINTGLFGDSDTIVINGTKYEKGFMTHPVSADTPSEITVDISRYSTEYPVFHVVVGKDDFTEAGGKGLPIAFKIFADGKEVCSGGPIDYGDEEEVFVNVSGAGELTLKCYSAGVFAWLTTNFANPYLCKLGVKEVRMAHAPDKVWYVTGEKLSTAGGEIEVSYENGSSETVAVTEGMVSGFDPLKTGEQTLKVSFEGSEFTYSVTVTDVKPYEPENVSGGEDIPQSLKDAYKDADIRNLRTLLIASLCLLGIALAVIAVLTVSRIRGKKK